MTTDSKPPEATRSSTARARLRAILGGERCVRMASIFDPISARIAADIGAQAGLMGGSIVSHVVLAAPDLIVLNPGELAEQVKRCAQAADVPVIVDGDHGYGNALNVMRTVQQLAWAGASALMIEDTDLPRPFGAAGQRPRLIDFDEAVGKVRAAVAARGAPVTNGDGSAGTGMAIFGRSSAATLAGTDEAIRRFRAFADAGVDAIFVPAAVDRAQLDRISAAVDVPIVFGDAVGDFADLDYLASRRVRLCGAGHPVFAVALASLYEAMKAIHEGVSPADLPGVAPKALVDRLFKAGAYDESVRRFMVPPA